MHQVYRGTHTAALHAQDYFSVYLKLVQEYMDLAQRAQMSYMVIGIKKLWTLSYLILED